MVRKSFSFILPIKMAISRQVLSLGGGGGGGGNLINLAAVEKTERTNMIELQYFTGMSRSEIIKGNEKNVFFFFFNFQ